MGSGSRLSSIRLFFSRVRQGNVADFVDVDEQFELQERMKHSEDALLIEFTD